MSLRESPAELMERLVREREGVRPARREVVRAAITGGRSYTPTRADLSKFWEIFDRARAGELHYGDASGVDRYVAAVVRRERLAVAVVAHPADWSLHGRRAGPLRNREMVAAVDLLIAFPGGRGTESCITEARKLGRPVHFVAEPEVAVRVVTPHVCAVKEWTWSLERAEWWGRCATCCRMSFPDKKLRALLESPVPPELLA